MKLEHICRTREQFCQTRETGARMCAESGEHADVRTGQKDWQNIQDIQNIYKIYKIHKVYIQYITYIKYNIYIYIYDINI